MDGSLSEIPWHLPNLWQEANAALAHAVQYHRAALDQPYRLAGHIKSHLASLFPLMDRLCEQTCPGCADICCGHACVWFDFRDLLYLHLAGLPVPQNQLRSRRGERCRYNSPQGCRLERLQRPFVCTWYLCPAQTRRIRETSGLMEETEGCLNEIKRLRRTMEETYLHTVI